MTTYYVKKGRRYVPVAHGQEWDEDRLYVGQFRLSFCAKDGSTRYSYLVDPDTAPVAAAIEIVREGMERAISDRAAATPQPTITPYTLQQLEILNRYRAEMASAGGTLPNWWNVSSPREIAQAGADALSEYMKTHKT